MIENTEDAMDGSVKSRLLNYWQNPAQGPQGERQTAAPQELDEFESRHRIRLPGDFRNFLEDVGGFDQNDHYQDCRGFNFWPLTKLARVSEYDQHRFHFRDDRLYFLFGDYLDFSWGYAIRVEGSSNEVILVGTDDGKPKSVARSFTDFIAKYLRDDSVLYP